MNFKNINILVLCMLSTMPSLVTKYDSVLNSINQKVSRINTLVTSISNCEKCTYEITAANIGTTGYTITSPGTYCLVNDVIFNPATPAPGQVVAAITIASSNVNLILGDHRLSQAQSGSASQSPFVIGILIPDVIPTNSDTSAIGLQSIYITGDQAIIDGFSMYGVRVLGHTYDIQISDLTIKNCGALASNAIRLQNPVLSGYVPNGNPYNVQLSPSANALGSKPLGVAGLCIGESDIFGMGPNFFTQTRNSAQNLVSSVILNNVSCLNNYFMGFCIANSTNVNIDNCHFDDTFCDDSTLYVAGAAFGPANIDAEMPSLLNLVVKNSTFNNSSFNGDYKTQSSNYLGLFVPGALLCRSSNIIFDQCQFYNTNSTFYGSYAVGFLTIAINDTVLSNCSFDGTQGIWSAAGFHVSGYDFYSYIPYSSQNLTLRNCTSNNIFQFGNLLQSSSNLYTGFFPAAVGYELYFVKNLVMENCTAENITSFGPTTATRNIVGFELAGGSLTAGNNLSDNTVFKDCLALRITSSQGGNAAGFTLTDNSLANNPTCISLDGCIVDNCQALVPTLSGGVQGVGVGYWFTEASSNGAPLTYTNCKALNNRGAANANTTNYSAGFFDQSTLVLTGSNHSYYNCDSLYNQYGFLLAYSSQCTIRNCRADNNAIEGFTDLGDTNTPAAVGISTSLFEGNHAYNNGNNDATYSGPGSNYNILVATDTTPPLLEVKVSSPGTSYIPINPVTYYASVHNISTIK